jgi:hypothetical protein
MKIEITKLILIIMALFISSLIFFKLKIYIEIKAYFIFLTFLATFMSLKKKWKRFLKYDRTYHAMLLCYLCIITFELYKHVPESAFSAFSVVILPYTMSLSWEDISPIKEGKIFRAINFITQPILLASFFVLAGWGRRFWTSGIFPFSELINALPSWLFVEREVWVEIEPGRGHWDLVLGESVWLVLIGFLTIIINVGITFVKIWEEKRKEAIKEFYGEERKKEEIEEEEEKELSNPMERM